MDQRSPRQTAVRDAESCANWGEGQYLGPERKALLAVTGDLNI